MTVTHRFVVVSGVPGCGKSTVGRALAEHLSVPYFDKDDILESYFEKQACTNEETRRRLSRSADHEFQAAALSSTVAVLDSFWRHPSSDTLSGTPSSWLDDPEIRAVEVLCRCSPENAAARFMKRIRHSGHLDGSWEQASLVAQSLKLLQKLPLGIGTLIEIDTTNTVDFKLLSTRVRTALSV